MKVYKAKLSWEKHIKCGQFTLLLVDENDNKKIIDDLSVPEDDISEINYNSMKFVLKDELNEWLNNENIYCLLSNTNSDDQYIYFLNSYDAIKFKITFDNIGEIVEEDIDDKYII